MNYLLRLYPLIRFKVLVLFALLFVCFSQEAYGQLRDLSLTSYNVVSYNIFTDKLTLKLTIRNDSTDFTIVSLTGLVYQNQHPLAYVTVANLYIPHGVSTIGAVCDISRCTGVSVFRLTQCFFPFDIRDYTVDVSIAVQFPEHKIEFKERKGIALAPRIELH